MADEDDFDLDIDIYGDDRPPEPEPVPEPPAATPATRDDAMEKMPAQSAAVVNSMPSAEKPRSSTREATREANTRPAHSKEAPDERDVDAEATTALKLAELEWWTTEEDIRGWAKLAGAEEELLDMTFNEHKINGKSKGCG